MARYKHTAAEYEQGLFLTVNLNENIVNKYDEKLVESDIEVFNKHLEGFKKYEFTGDTDKLVFQYFKLMNYMFVSPFFSFFRNVY